MKTHLLRSALLASVSATLLLSAPVSAQTAPATSPPSDDNTNSDIIVTGTRQTGTRAADSAAPIQIVGAQAIESNSQQELGQALGSLLPSFNVQGWGGDTANLTLSAALRGLSPNDTLILLNGKRLHGTANLAIAGEGAAQGGAAPDLSLIPTAAVARIEVLQDGAAAQYGSDAIAGVVNIILKNADHGLTYSGSLGQTYQGDGARTAQSLNLGLKLGDRGFLNLTGEYKYQGYAQRGGTDYRVYNPDGSIASYATAQNIAGAAATPGAPFVNREFSGAQYMAYNLAANAGYDLGSDISLYFDGTFGHRSSRSYENYRTASVISGVDANGNLIYPFPQGFSPLEQAEELNYTVTGGIKGKTAGWNWDLSLTYGRDRQAIYSIEDANGALFQDQQVLSTTPVAVQRNFYDGTFTNKETTANLDLSRDYDLGLARPLTVALGAEFRSDNFSIQAGEPNSYYKGSLQAYPGFAPTDQSDNSRHNWAGYIDLATNPVKALHLDLAGRYETYSDFGSVWTGKFNARYDISPAFALRGTISNGFRAPTLAEEYYSATSVSPFRASIQLPPNSAAAALAGLSPLKPEKSTNFSAGVVAHPVRNLQLTLDAYQITIRDRIIASGSLIGWNNGVTVSQAVLDAIAARGAVISPYLTSAAISAFTNGANTRTRGIEATLNYTSIFGAAGKVDWSLGFNYNQTAITHVEPLPAALVNVGYGQTSLLSPAAISNLTTASPRVKVVGNALWSIGKWTVNLRETLYGTSSVVLSPDGTGINGVTARIGATFLTDLDVGYRLTRNLRLDAGAANLFNHQAPTIPNVPSGSSSGPPLVPANGLPVWNAPLPITPWGIYGGTYYARVTLNF